MTLLNQILAFGAAAFLIPLVIHILNRRRFRSVEWGAMHLLESVLKVNHRRFQFEQWILLFVRCAIPVLLAVCLARPILTGPRILAGDAPTSMVILVDTSYSMDAVGESGSRLKEAIDAACEFVAATGSGSEISVIQTGGSAVPLFEQPITDADAMIRRLKQLQGGYGASRMQDALDQALATLATMTNARRELIVISDFQPADWEDVGVNAEALRQRLQAMTVEPVLTLLPVGSPMRDNVTVESLQFPSKALGVGQQLPVRAYVRNYGTAAYETARVLLRVDGAESSVTQVTLAVNGITQVLFPCTFDTAGSHVLEVEVIVDDALPTDNRHAAAVTVWNSVDVLLVDGEPSSQPLQSETDYLSVALTPLAFGRVRLEDLVETKTIAPSALNEEVLKAPRVVVLANVPRLDDPQLQALTRYVRDGGALMVCAGNRIDVNWYNEQLFARETGLLPAAFGALRGQVDGAGESSRIVTGRFDHPALELFNDPTQGDLSSAEIRQWYELRFEEDAEQLAGDPPEPNDTSTTPADSDRVLMARLATGEPLLVERRFGEGVVVQLATACDADWSDLPLRPVFVPLIQQLVTSMASRISPPRNIRTGDPAVALLSADDVQPMAQSGDAGTTAAADAAAPVTLPLVTPDGARRTVLTEPRGPVQVARFSATQRPGIYTMSLPTARSLHFVAETSRSESAPASLDKSAITELAESLGGSAVTSLAGYLEEDQLRRYGREIWRYVLAAFLIFLFLEVVLQQRFARVRT